MAWNAVGFAAPRGRERRSSLLMGGQPSLRPSRAFTPRFDPANLLRRFIRLCFKRLKTALIGVALLSRSAYGAPAANASTPNATAAAAAQTSQVTPAAEKTLEFKAVARPGGTHGAEGDSTTKGRPLVTGQRIPEALRAQMKAVMDARIDKDLVSIKSLRVEAIDLLTRFVNETPRESPEMPEAMMRLGELRWELEREQFIDRFKAWESRPLDQRGTAPEPNFSPSRQLFARVLADYPWFEEYDLALYVDGFLATEQGKHDEALARFERIIREFPKSRFTPDAHMTKAETLLNEKYDYAGALSEYEFVLQYPKSELYGLALFKSAWCQWRLGNSDEAAKRFVAVFALTDERGGKAKSSQDRKQLDELQAEALKYLVEVLTEDEKNTANDAYNFLQRMGGDRFAGKVVKALAETFYDQSHYERGIEAYELLLKLDPTNKDAPDWVMQIAAGYFTIEDYPHLKATYERAISGYSAGGPWAHTQGDPSVVTAASQRMEEQIKEHALALHGKAQHDKTSRAEFEAAASMYEVYLSHFASGPQAFQIQYNLGEIDFYHLNSMTEAAKHYVASARGMPEDKAKEEPFKSQRHDALYNAIAALDRQRQQELEARKGKTLVQESETDKTFAETLDYYAQLYPTDPALPDLLFRQGKLYYDYKVYDTAVKIWGNLLEKFPNSSAAPPAGELILDSFNKSNNYDNIETWARRLKTAHGFESAAQQARLDTLIVQSVFKQGEQKGAANDHLGAAAAYLRAAKEFPRESKAAQACVNAELEAQKAGDIATLKEAAQLATGKEYRDKPESPIGAWTAAQTLQSMGIFDEAADFDEAIESLNNREHPYYSKYEHTKDAAYNSVVLRVATGEHDKAIADGNRFLKEFPNAPEADEVVFLMGKAHQNAGRNKEAAGLYQRYLARAKNQDHRVEGLVLLAEADIKGGDEKAADAVLAEAVAIGKKRSRELGANGKFAAAHARYMEGERVLAKFEKIQIGGDVKQLASRLKQKAALLKEAANVFLDTVSLGVAEWSTAALYQIGHTYEAFAKSLRDAPPPANLSDADKDAYTAQIEEFVVPMEERSLDAYENGWKKAIELGIYNQWTAKLRESLGRLNAELYPPIHEIGVEVRSASVTPLPPLIDAPRRNGEPTPTAGPKTATPTPPPSTITPSQKGART
jgi:cellulose synthase operon protein C